MSKPRFPVRHRRYSLPATSSLSPFGCLSVPEGSDTFQKALEELYSDDPNQAPTTRNNGFALNGLNNILEGNESEYSESEDNNNSSQQNQKAKMSRRHSSPSFLPADNTDGQFKNSGSVKGIQDSLIKSHQQYRKDYFIKHGHWPVPSTNRTPRKLSRPRSFYEPARKGQEVSFGTSSTALASQIAKLRV